MTDTDKTAEPVALADKLTAYAHGLYSAAEAGMILEAAKALRTKVDVTGWKLVPDQPTEAMWQAGRSADLHPGDSYSKVWAAMFDAAPDVEDCETTQAPSPAPSALRGALERQQSQYDKDIDRARDDRALSETGREHVINDLMAGKRAVAVFVENFLSRAALAQQEPGK